jgi:hypothetical protein
MLLQCDIEIFEELLKNRNALSVLGLLKDPVLDP